MSEEKFELTETEAVPSGALIEIEKSRAVQEVQAALVIAKKFPRDVNASYTATMRACERLSLAERSLYQYPRGGEIVKGPSIRLAEVLAQNYGNLDFGIRELERRANSSVAEAYCHDLQTNTRQTKVFEVPHEIGTKKGIKKLTDPRDIYELVANNGARRMRACILGIIPADITEAAVKRCERTLAQGDGEPLEDRIRKMLVAFQGLGVPQELIEKKLGHPVSAVVAEELVDLMAVYTSLRDKQAKRSDFFDIEETVISEATQKLNEKFKAKAGKENESQ